LLLSVAAEDGRERSRQRARRRAGRTLPVPEPARIPRWPCGRERSIG
jgi:hypothetical protein